MAPLSFTRSTVAGLALSLLVAGGVTTLAPLTGASAAGAKPVTAGQAAWGFKATFRSYVAEESGRVDADRAPRASITVGNGASFDGTVNSTLQPAVNKAPYLWPAATSAGTYDPTTAAGTVHFAGSVTFSREDHWMHELTFKNPTVVLSGHGTGELLVDVKRDFYGGTSSLPASQADTAQLHIADLSNVPAPTVVDNGNGTTTSTFGAMTTALTVDGGHAVGDFYAAGAVVDPFSMHFTHGSATVTTTSTLTVSPSTVAYGKARTAKVTVASAGGVPTGTVTVREGTKVLGSPKLDAKGVATLALPASSSVGKHSLNASYGGSTLADPSTAAPRGLTVVKAKPSASAKLAKKKVTTKAHAKVTVKIGASGFVPSGKVTVAKGAKTLKSGQLRKGSVKLTLPKLKKGSYSLKVRYGGSSTTAATSKTVHLTVKKP